MPYCDVCMYGLKILSVQLMVILRHQQGFLPAASGVAVILLKDGNQF